MSDHQRGRDSSHVPATGPALGSMLSPAGTGGRLCKGSRPRPAPRLSNPARHLRPSRSPIEHHEHLKSALAEADDVAVDRLIQRELHSDVAWSIQGGA